MKTNKPKSNYGSGSGGGTGDPLYPGAPSYTSAADVRADIDALSEDEAKAIFAEVNGARTENYLPKFNADGELEASVVEDASDRINLGKPLVLASTGGIINSVSIGRVGSSGFLFDTPIGGTFQWRFGAWGVGARMSITGLFLGMGATAAARRLEITDSTDPQLRLSHTPGTHWVDLQALSGGGLQFHSSAGAAVLTMTAGATLRSITSTASLTLEAGVINDIKLRVGSLDVFASGVATGGTKISDSSVSTRILGSDLRFFTNGTGASRASAIPDATNATDVITRVNAVLAALRSWNLVAT